MYRTVRNTRSASLKFQSLGLSRRFLMEDAVKKPKVEQVVHTSHQRPAPGAASSVKNGTMGTDPLLKEASARTFGQQLPKALGALAAVLAVFVIWPFGTVEGSKIVESVPSQDTAAAKINSDGKVEVDIPQTYAHLDKPSEDDE